MKKDKKPGPKQKEFASRPFAPLKGVRAEPQVEPQVEPRRAQPAPSEPEPEPEPELSTDDAELFLRAVADARRFSPAPATAAREKPAPLPPSRLDDEERHLFIDALKDLQLDVSFRDELPGQEEPARPLPVNRLRQLRRGAIRLDLQLDLHGLTRDEALKSLAAFITSAHNRGQKAVLVITGKGNRSPGEPVLQGAVTGWLRERGKGMVAEFAPAPREMGGGGAFVVFLKGKEKDGTGE